MYQLTNPPYFDSISDLTFSQKVDPHDTMLFDFPNFHSKAWKIKIYLTQSKIVSSPDVIHSEIQV
jgi:hypothetical protein